MNQSFKTRLVFMGTSRFAQVILESLLKAGYNVVAAYTQPDKKAGREQKIQKTAVREIAEKNRIAVFSPERFDEKTTEELKNLMPDLIVVAAYGKILPKNVLEIPALGALNVHASLLPKFRGPSPIQNAILNGESETGATIMLMDEGIDTGKILSRKKTALDENETAAEAFEKLSRLSAELLLEILPLWTERKIVPEEQDHSKATLCQLIERADGKIIWAKEAKAIYDKYRAFFVWPGVFAFWQKNNSLRRIKLNKIFLSAAGEPDKKPGEVFEKDGRIFVQTGKGAIGIEEIQMEGKPAAKINDFLNGYPDFIGSVLK